MIAVLWVMAKGVICIAGLLVLAGIFEELTK